MADVDPSDRSARHTPSRVKELLDQLSDLGPAARDAALGELAKTEREQTLQAVRRLLESHDRAGTFLGASAEPAQSFGPYTLDRRIGEGGFGEVWTAEQSSPVRRRVAIKILKRGMDSRSILARFEAERQALAIMEHANIARVFDAGTTPQGLPYFVMEFVDGLPITAFCDEHRLSVTERLQLLLPVCRAVHHAHQKGVIHRDIKPGNVIIGTVDGVYVPKVIDFGIAKALDRSLTEQTFVTEHRAMIGTPEYMSPEQADVGVDIDTRADIYSLGVLMYELLAGVTPFDPKDLRHKAFSELQRIIKEVDPPAPSQRAGRLPSAATVAGLRRTEAGRLSRIVRGELDWIVMKCLEKDRARRYDSASALAGDLENYLAGRDVLAGPPSRAYRIRKMARRNRGLVAGVAGVSFALVAGLISTLLMLGEAQRQQRIATEQRSLAEVRAIEAADAATRAQTVSEFLERTIVAADPYQQVAADPKLSEVLRLAVAQLESGSLSSQPEAQASLQMIVARTLAGISDYQKAEQLLRQAVRYRRSQSPRHDLELARAVMLLGNALTSQSRYTEAESHYREAAEIARSIPDPSLDEAIAFNIATSLMSQMRYAEAHPLLQGLLQTRRDRGAQAPLELADLLDALGQTEVRLGRSDRAHDLLRESLELRRRLQPADALSTAETAALLAEALAARNLNDEAIAVLEEAVGRVRGRAAEVSGTTAMLYEVLGRRYSGRKDHARAAELIAKALEIRQQVDGPTHLRTARARVQLGEQLFAAGKQDDARDHLRAAWAILRDRDDYPMQARVEAASQLAPLSRDDDEPGATELFEFSMRHFRAQPRRTPQEYKCIVNFFSNRYLAGDYAKALSLANEMLSTAIDVFDDTGPEVALARSYVARANLKATGGDLPRACAEATHAMQILDELGQTRSALWLSAQSLLGEALGRLGQQEEGAAALASALAGFRAIQNPTPQVQRAILDTQERIAHLENRSKTANLKAEWNAQP